MNPLRYLKTCFLVSRTKTRQTNGSITESFTDLKSYEIQVQDIYDEVSASLYGSDVNKMIRLCSPHNVLENDLLEKVNFTSDNITKYGIRLGKFIYEIVSVKQHWIDVKILCEINEIISA